MTITFKVNLSVTTRKCVNYYQVLRISILFYDSLDRYKKPIKKKSIEIFKNIIIILILTNYFRG